MKKVGDLFAELGFRPDASDGAKKAFIENLVRAAGATTRQKVQQTFELPAEPPVVRPEDTKVPQQMSFNLDLGELRRSPQVKSGRRSG